MSNIVSKLSASTMGVDLSDARTVAKAYFQVIGRATSVETEKGTPAHNEPWNKLRGEFEGVNLATGEIFVSSACFLPTAVTGLIVAQLVDESSVVEFAFEIGTKPSKTPVGYEYTVKELFQAAPTASLTHLRELTAIGGNTLKAVESGHSKK